MQVAKMLYSDRSTYAYYETGKTKPDVDTLLKLCVVYDVTLDYLVGNREDNCRAVLAAGITRRVRPMSARRWQP